MSKVFAFLGLAAGLTFAAGAWRNPAGTAAVSTGLVNIESVGVQGLSGATTITTPKS